MTTSACVQSTSSARQTSTGKRPRAGRQGRQDRAHRHQEPLRPVNLHESQRSLACLAGRACGRARVGCAEEGRRTPAQKDADRHFKSGVALFKEAQVRRGARRVRARLRDRAAPDSCSTTSPACHRELSHYGEAVKYYKRFLDEGKGKVPATRLTTAQTELDCDPRAHRPRHRQGRARDGATLILDGDDARPRSTCR